VTHLASHMERRDYFSPRVATICPACLRPLEGALREEVDGLFMDKTCPEHGAFESLLAPDLASYRDLCRGTRKVTQPLVRDGGVAHGCPHDCGLCPEHDQHTCLAILEITSRCDLGCPVCLTDSQPQGADLSLARVEHALCGLAACEGGLSPLQLGGGEPTQHPELLAVVKLARSLGGDRIELDTNGLALAQAPGLAPALREAGLSGVYLQMDTLDPVASHLIRGRDLVSAKMTAITNCLRAGLEVVVSVTVVPGVNDRELWSLVRFGLDQGLTGISFQALAMSGRFPPDLAHSHARMTGEHFRREIARQSGGTLFETDLSPIPCPDPRCALMSYALVIDGELRPLGRRFAEEQLADCLADQKDWPQTIRHLERLGGPGGRCACGGSDPARSPLLVPGVDYFTIGFHGMMDAYSLDLARARRCCVHLLRPDGGLVPFCLYNALNRSRPRPA
jgi:uncharacterized radical SAM superfamily Fe-S cluster-containing enzyme